MTETLEIHEWEEKVGKKIPELTTKEKEREAGIRWLQTQADEIAAERATAK